MQKITVVGNLGRDPEEKVTTSGLKLITFSVAVQAGKDKTVWYDINIWDEKIAMFSGMLPHLKKGSRILILGDLAMPETYQTKAGETRIKMKIQPFSMNFLPSGEKKEQASATFQPQLANEWEALNSENPPF